jgi:preprotein translocase subunit SecA
MLQNFVKLFGGDPNKREIEKLSELVEVINGLEPEFETLSDDELRAKTDVFRAKLKDATDGIENDEERFEIARDSRRNPARCLRNCTRSLQAHAWPAAL